MQAKINLFALTFFPHIIDDQFVDSLMAHVAESIRSIELPKSRYEAQDFCEYVACRAVCEMWTAAFPGKKYKPNGSWPRARAIILDNPRRVVLEMWIGQDYQQSETPDPIEIFLDGE